MKRRDFLKYSLNVLIALNFGCSLKGLVGEGEKVALIYGTKYGSTRDTAAWIQEGLEGNAALMNVEEMDFGETVSRYDSFIAGSGVWIDGIHKKLKEFLKSHSTQLQERVLGSFVVCGSQDTTEGGRKRIAGYLRQISSPLGYQPAANRFFGGRIIVEQLTDSDREALETFYSKFLNQELHSWDRTDKYKAVKYGKELEQVIEKYSVRT